MSLKKSALFVLLMSVVFIPAQNILTEAENKYTPNSSSVFNSSSKESYQSSTSTNIDLISSIKFCPTALIRQKVSIFWEMDLYGNDFPINIGLGFAFGNNWSDRFYFSRFTSLTTFRIEDDVLDPTELMNNSRFKGGWLLHGGYKFYISRNAFDGLYIEPFYTFERMNYTLNEIVNDFEVDSYFGDDYNFSYRVHNIGLTLGFGTATGGNIMCTHDLFLRVGAKFFGFDRYELDQVGFSPPEFKYRKTTTYNHRIIPAIVIGYAIGIGW